MNLDIEIDIPCPGCKRKFKEKVKNLKPGKSKVCPHCQKTIEYSGEDIPKSFQKSLDNLKRTIKNLNKTFTIKL